MSINLQRRCGYFVVHILWFIFSNNRVNGCILSHQLARIQTDSIAAKLKELYPEVTLEISKGDFRLFTSLSNQLSQCYATRVPFKDPKCASLFFQLA